MAQSTTAKTGLKLRTITAASVVVLAIVAIGLFLFDDDPFAASRVEGGWVDEAVRPAVRVHADGTRASDTADAAPDPIEEADVSEIAGADAPPTRGPMPQEDGAEDTPLAPAVVRGRVEDPWGEPFPEATITSRSMGRRGRGGGEVPAVQADALGRFELTFRPGGAALVAEAPGLAPSETQWVRLEPGSTQEVVLRMREATALRGRVETDDGRPALGAKVTVGLRRAGRAGPQPAEAVADVDGRFELDGLAEGLYWVRATLPGFVDASMDDVPVSLERGGDVALSLVTAGRVEGTLRRPDGTPVVGGLVFPQLEARGRAQVVSDAEGRYVLADLPPGDLELFVRSEDYGFTAREIVGVTPGKLTVFDLVVRAGPKIRGVLRDAAGDPLEGLAVRARSEEGGVRREGTSDAEGQYTIENLYPGDYTVSVAASQRGAALTEREVELGASDAVLDLLIPTGATLAGRVVGPDGVALADVTVHAIVGEDYRGRARTDDEGAFSLDELPADTYRLLVRVGDDRLVGAIERIVLQGGDQRVDLQIVARAPATLRGRLLDVSGRGIEGVTLEATAPDTPVSRRARTDAEGRFELGPLYDGPYVLTADEGPLALLARKLGVSRLTVDPVAFEVGGGGDLELDLSAVAVEE